MPKSNDNKMTNDKYQRKSGVGVGGAVSKRRMGPTKNSKFLTSRELDVPRIEEDRKDVGDKLEQLLQSIRTRPLYLPKQPDHLEVDRHRADTDNNEQRPIILLDLETSSFRGDCDILQIAAKCGAAIFETYVTPTQPICPRSSEINGLTTVDGVLMYNGIPVPSDPIEIALRNLLKWITSVGKKCYIATHNLSFDGPRLYNNIKCYSLGNAFSEVIYGFIDTLQVIRNKTERKERGECTIKGLAEWLNISIDGAHNAVYDVNILTEILLRAGITGQMLTDGASTYLKQTQGWDFNGYLNMRLPTIFPLNKIVSKPIWSKMVKASITIEDLRNIYQVGGRYGIERLLREEVHGKPLVTNRQGPITKIVEYISKGTACNWI